MKLLLLLLRSLLLTIFIVLLTTCNASESDTNIPKNSESVQIPEDENWKIFEDNGMYRGCCNKNKLFYKNK